MFVCRKILTIFTALAVCFAAPVLADNYTIEADYGRWKKGCTCLSRRKHQACTSSIGLPSGTCVMKFLKLASSSIGRKWVCDPVEEKQGKKPSECATNGVSLYKGKDGNLRLDYYRTRFGYRKKAEAHFCAGKGVKMTKRFGKGNPVYFYWEASDKQEKERLTSVGWDGHYLSVNTKQTPERLIIRQQAEEEEEEDTNDEE